MIEQVEKFHKSWRTNEPVRITQLPPSASPRKYFRVYVSDGTTYITAWNSNVEENEAFISFAKHFRSQNLPVPEIYRVHAEKHFYALEDLGDTQLFHIIKEDGFTEKTISLLEKSLDKLFEIQTRGIENLDLSVAFPRAEFDETSIMWDLNYFKYYFLKLSEIDFNEQRLENDFIKFTQTLLQPERKYFLYRDFQTRNIMIVNGEPYFIDFQGGRKGALHYDVASLLYDANADIPQEIREKLLSHYLEILSSRYPQEAEEFHKYFNHFVLVRMLQALGAFGFRGLVQRKQLFIEAIPPAIANLQKLLEEKLPLENCPELRNALLNLKNYSVR